MREFVGMACVAVLFSGAFMLYNNLNAADSAPFASSDERLNKCVTNGFSGRKYTTEVRVEVCGCILKEIDRSFTAREGDLLFQGLFDPPENIASIWEGRNFSQRDVYALGKKVERFLREVGPRCERDLKPGDESGGV